MSNSDEKPGFFVGSPLSFRGNFTHSIDAKGRVSLPAEFRRVLADHGECRVVLTNYISQGARCLEGFGLESWNKFEAKLREKSRFSAKLQQLENFYLSRAAELSLDGSDPEQAARPSHRC